MLRLAAGLPDALVRLPPHLRRALRLSLDDRPEPPRQTLRLAGVQQDRVEHRAEDVVLPLVEGAVADPHRARALVAGELVTGRLGQIATAVDPVHDLQRAVLGGLEVGDELDELVGLPVEVEAVERLQRERCVAHPGVAVVPVALAAGRLRQRCGQRRDRGAGGHVGEALDRERRALDRVAEAVIRDARPAEPVAPEARRRGHPRLRLVRRSRARRAPPPRRGRSRRALRLRACAVRGRGCPRCRAPGPSGDGSSARRRSRRRCAGRRRRGPTPRRAAVVEGGLADELDLDLALDALHGAEEHVVGVLVGGRPACGA